MHNLDLTYEQLAKLIRQINKELLHEMLIEAGLVPEIITGPEVIKNYGVSVFEKSRKYVRWQKKGKAGKTSTWYCMRTDFIDFLSKYDIELTNLKFKT